MQNRRQNKSTPVMDDIARLSNLVDISGTRVSPICQSKSNPVLFDPLHQSGLSPFFSTSHLSLSLFLRKRNHVVLSTFASSYPTENPYICNLFSAPHFLSIPTRPFPPRFPRLTPANLVKSSNSPQFASQPLYDAVPHPQPEEEEEEPPIGDCLVFEEGVFNDPFIQNTRNFRSDEAQLSKPNNNKDKGTTISPENLIPEDWVHVQRELNITKKERRKLSQQLEYGRRVEKRRQALMPLNSGEYEKFKNEKLQKLKPIVLDDPEPKYLGENDKHEKDDDERNGEAVRGRVAPRNPRLAVYGGGLEDISALFSSGSYEPGAADKSQGTRKLFSKEEKILMNRRIPDIAVATSGKWHPLHTLAASGQFYLVNALLKHNLDINVPDKDGLTAIHKAILGKKQAIFNFLLRESANPFIRDNDGWTPLHLAVQSRRTDVVRLLLIKGADKTLKNRDGLTPLDLCLYSGRDTRTYELIKLLKRFP
ncbi:UNVERIFIED_CONTAM: Ankyrin repeat domain-containing protein, chloroplastic [Sesamum latifolium]|uniref:Ankyrin repeat domain-containing protein, chloroplastic n=1 Tax=Sesamum latifolium TaxID=2727402 RepID=A0AAW2YDB1_9LAMI